MTEPETKGCALCPAARPDDWGERWRIYGITRPGMAASRHVQPGTLLGLCPDCCAVVDVASAASAKPGDLTGVQEWAAVAARSPLAEGFSQVDLNRKGFVLCDILLGATVLDPGDVANFTATFD